MHFLLMLLAMLGPAESQGKVTKLLRANIGHYDDQGVLIRRVPKDSAPKLPLAVVARAPSGELGVRWGGEVVYLRNSEVIAEGLQDICVNTAKGGRAGGTAVAASEGMGSGMGGRSSPCVR
jgi:hypothetical protein